MTSRQVTTTSDASGNCAIRFIRRVSAIDANADVLVALLPLDDVDGMSTVNVEVTTSL